MLKRVWDGVLKVDERGTKRRKERWRRMKEIKRPRDYMCVRLFTLAKERGRE